MAFTSEQLKAINERGGSIIVSAAAGSGKTAVLTERIITYLKNGGTLDRLLVVTFTNLAATEMKERIRAALVKENLYDQLLIIDNAKIMTMDAFYNKILLENALSFNINPNFKLLDDVKYKILKKEAVKNIIESNMKLDVLNNFFNIKGLTVGEDVIIKLAESLNKIPFNETFVLEMLNNFSKNNFNETVWGLYLYNELENIVSSFLSIYDDKIEAVANDSVLVDRMHDFLINEKNCISEIHNGIVSKNYNNIKNALDFTFERLPSIKGTTEHPTMLEIKEIRTILKDEIKKYKELFINDEITLMSIIHKQKNILLSILDYIAQYNSKLTSLKGEFMTFDDIAGSVLKMLVKSYNYQTDELVISDLASDIALEYDEILIDEYQDTNMLQDLIFRAISNNNLFVVGDVKQSIYAFRGSEPDIMVKVKENYFIDKFPMLITLSKNFRSRFEILDFTNYIFKKIMSSSFGAIDYNESEYLYLGANYLENSENKIKITVINEDKDDDKDDIKKDIKEATHVANEIKKLILKGESPSDIAILIRDANSKAEFYRNALQNVGVSVYTGTTTRYFDQYEVKLMISLLKIIVKKDLISIVAVLRSPLFGYDEDIILNNVDNMEALISDKLVIYKQKAREMSLDQFINFLYVDLNVFDLMTKLERGEARFKNLLELLKHANNYKTISNNLSDFVLYLDDLIKNDLTLEGANPAPSTSSVLITSIHKSKGLQFKHVFMPSLSKQFNKNDLKEEIMFDKDYYISFKVREVEEFDGINKEVIKLNKMKKMLEEEMRILYVGLTRACEYLYLSFTTTNFNGKVEKVLNLTNNGINYLYLRDCSSYMDFILPVILKSRNAKEIVEETLSYSKYDAASPNFSINIIKLSDIEVSRRVYTERSFSEEVLNNLKKSNVFIASETKKTVSVTDLKGISLPVPRIINKNMGFAKGLSYHKVLEGIPFINYDLTTLEEAIISIDDEVKAVKLYPFFNSKLYNEILKSKILKEEEISFMYNDSLIEGVIDLLCIFDDKYYIIDYKSDVVTPDELINRYKLQLDLYEIALKTKKVVKKYIYSIHNEMFIEL